jgi:uroporphyrinogen decarboxylase
MSRTTPKVYPTDTLTAEERLEAVVRLERPDRVPVALFIYYFAPAHCGIRVSEFMRSRAVYARTMRRVYEDIGPWDIFYNADSFSKLLYSYSAMMRVLWPGVDLPEGPMAQTQELPYMGAEEYDRLRGKNFPGGRLLVFLEVVEKFKRLSRKPLAAYLIGPYTLSGLLMGANRLAAGTIGKPGLLKRVMEFSAELITRYAAELKRRGADYPIVLDPTSVIMSPVQLATVSAPFVEQAVAGLMARMKEIDDFIFSTGCDLPPETPQRSIAHLESVFRARTTIHSLRVEGQA